MDVESIGEDVRQSRIWDSMSTDTGNNQRRKADSKAQKPEESKGKGSYSRAAYRSREQEHQYIISF